MPEGARPVAASRLQPAREWLLPVLPPLAALLPPGGLRRGWTVTVSGSTSLLLALLAGPSQEGSWCAIVGLASLGVLAAAEAGVALDRLALVAAPGPEWPVVVAALLDALDVVVVAPPASVRRSDARRLTARARERGAVLLPFGTWEDADLRLSVTDVRWEGLGSGVGHLAIQQVVVRAEGRRAAGQPRQTRLWLPGRTGEVVPVTSASSFAPLGPELPGSAPAPPGPLPGSAPAPPAPAAPGCPVSSARSPVRPASSAPLRSGVA